MPYSLYYFSDVKLDIQEAKVWYKKQQAGLEKRFIKAIKTAILQLKENPFAYAVRYKNIRIVHPKTFPYSIHFYINDTYNQIIILAITHSKKHPNKVKNRIANY